MEFDTVKKDKQHREYIMEYADAQALTKKIYNILESRPLSAMNEASHSCLKCSTIFVYKRPSKFGVTESAPSCPVCGSTVVEEVEEPKMPEKNDSVSKPLSHSPSQSSIGSARSMEQGLRPEALTNPRKYESDIEVISNPSQSSIEVIDESSRSQSVTPMRKKSDDRQTAFTTEQSIREMLSPLSALTESSSSEEENGNEASPKSPKDVYSFTDLDMELRLKTYIYHDVFTSENEELCSLVRCHIWKTGGSDYDGCFVLSTTAVYFLFTTTANFSDQSNWFSLNESYRIADLRRVQPIIWYQGLEIQIKNFSFILLLMDGDRTQNLIKDFNGLTFKGVKVVAKPNPKVELSLQQSVLTNDLNHNSEDPSVIHMVLCRSLEISKVEVDEEEYLRLAGLVLTCGLFIVIPGDLSWLCSGAQPSIVASRDLSSLIEVEKKDMQLVFHFLDEAEAVEELWSVKFGVSSQIDSLLDAIRRPWERRFSVPLEITGL
uniref:Serine/threonine-protein kinase 11-interacting protein n=1 Tax=Lygus hesperus TaxID=30085 RepID=A0A0K8SIK0_LYGHE